MAVWFITGTSSGFGSELALKALSEGHQVVATARDTSALSHLPDDNCLKLTLDVTKQADVKKAVDAAIEAHGRIDVLVNNAGQGLIGAVEEHKDQEIIQSFAVNFLGPVKIIQHVLPHMREQKSGTIINMSAIAGFVNHAGFGAYGAAKFALEGMSEALKEETKPLGIHVMLVEPGPFRTDFIGKSVSRTQNHIADYDVSSGKFAKLIESINGKQPGSPEKAANVIFDAACSAKPPFRLMLGEYAYKNARAKLKSMEVELSEWEERALATNL